MLGALGSSHDRLDLLQSGADSEGGLESGQWEPGTQGSSKRAQPGFFKDRGGTFNYWFSVPQKLHFEESIQFRSPPRKEKPGNGPVTERGRNPMAAGLC